MKTIMEIIKRSLVQQCNKHGLNRENESCDEYAERRINYMTNVQLIQEIDKALAEIFMHK